MIQEDRADVLVVSAAPSGPAAWHLLADGAGDVMVIERDGVADGTSYAGAGFVELWAAGRRLSWEEDLALERYAIDFYHWLDSESNTFDFEENGLLWLALSEDGWSEELSTRASHPGAPERHSVSGADVTELTRGVVIADRIHRTVYEPTVAEITAPGAVAAVMTQFLARGGRLQGRRPVTGVVMHGDRVVGVDTTEVGYWRTRWLWRAARGRITCSSSLERSRRW